MCFDPFHKKMSDDLRIFPDGTVDIKDEIPACPELIQLFSAHACLDLQRISPSLF